MKKLRIYDNNSMSLSCDGSIIIDENNIVTEINFKGYPRTDGDGWTYFFKNIKRGDFVSEEKIKSLLSWNKKYNLIAYIEILITKSNTKTN